MYLIPTLIGILLLLVVLAVWLMVYSDLRKIHGGGRPVERHNNVADLSAEPGAEPPPAAAVHESSEDRHTKQETETPVDGGGR